MPLRSALTRLLRTQETFNSLVVQYVNHQHHTISEEQAAMMEELHRYREALKARERRMDTAMTALLTENAELKTAVGVLQQQVRSNRSSGSDRSEPFESTDADPEHRTIRTCRTTRTIRTHSRPAYVGFEDQFRGSPEAIRARLLEYIPIFAGASRRARCGVRARRVSAVADGARHQRARHRPERGDGGRLPRSGLDATVADVLSYLRGLPDGSLGGLFAAQVVEHLQPGYLTQFLDAAFDKLRPGAPIVPRDDQPGLLVCVLRELRRDITHVRPLHPDTLKFLLVATGFQQIEIRYRAPYPEAREAPARRRVRRSATPPTTLERERRQAQ